MHWAGTLFVAASLLMFAVPAMAIAVAIWGMLAARLFHAIFHPSEMPSALLATLLWGTFAGLFGYGAWQLGAKVINGLIGRFL